MTRPSSPDRRGYICAISGASRNGSSAPRMVPLLPIARPVADLVASSRSAGHLKFFLPKLVFLKLNTLTTFLDMLHEAGFPTIRFRGIFGEDRYVASSSFPQISLLILASLLQLTPFRSFLVLASGHFCIVGRTRAIEARRRRPFHAAALCNFFSSLGGQSSAECSAETLKYGESRAVAINRVRC